MTETNTYKKINTKTKTHILRQRPNGAPNVPREKGV